MSYCGTCHPWTPPEGSVKPNRYWNQGIGECSESQYRDLIAESCLLFGGYFEDICNLPWCNEIMYLSADKYRRMSDPDDGRMALPDDWWHPSGQRV